MSPVSLIVAGAGNRGHAYGDYALRHPELAKIVGVAEPREAWRNRFASAHELQQDTVFTDWREMADRPRFADAVVIAVQDAMHQEVAAAFAARGYHLLLEKPMAPDEAGCRAIVSAAREADVILAVCHVLRYTRYTQRIKRLLADGAIGEVVGVERLEPVGFWHQAHSFVRGNWRRQDESSFMLLAKSCHDLDWIRYIVDSPCRRLASFGTLKHFRPENRPDGAGERCVDCAVERECPYSAIRIYLERIQAGHTGWPVAVLDPDPTEASIRAAIETGPYGRCVYACDNDVVDHQVVTMEFDQGRSASFTMTAFTETRPRNTRIFGTHGEIYGDGKIVDVYNFLTDRHTTIDTSVGDGSGGGHGGGDYYLMEAFVEAVRKGDQSLVLSGPEESLETHRMVFAAERARRDGTVVSLE